MTNPLTPNPRFTDRYIFLQPDTQRARASYMSPIESEDVNLFISQVYQDIVLLYQELDALTAKKNQAMFALTGKATPDYPATPADYSATPGFAHYSATPSYSSSTPPYTTPVPGYVPTRDVLQSYVLRINRMRKDLSDLNKVMRT